MRFNEERLIHGLLPPMWMFGYLGIVILIGLVSFPKTLPKGIIFAVLVLVGLGLMIAAHRIAKQRLLKHFIKWHDAGEGGRVGRDLNPVPHRYQHMTQEEHNWARKQQTHDAATGKLMVQGKERMQREDSLLRNQKIKRKPVQVKERKTRV